MKIFVTGGTGFIGSYVLKDLCKLENYEIIASKRASSRMDLVSSLKGVKWMECDLLDVVQMEEILKECDAVIHMAGSVSFSPWKKKQIFSSNINVTANLVNLAIDQKIDRFIHFSSVAALGPSSKMIDESQVWSENNSQSLYSLSKYLGEKEAWRGFAEGLNLSIVNPSFTIGGSYWNYGPMSMITRLDNGLQYYPTGSNGAVDVRDVSKLCISLLQRKDLSGRRFICSGHNISHLDMMKLMCDELQKPYPTKPISGIMGALAWRGASLFARLKGKETLFSKEAYEISSADISYNNAQSQELLGMEYTPLEKTIIDTIKCYKESKLKSKKYGMF